MNEPSSNRLNKLLALKLGISRREADELIENGSVSIDGKTAILGARARDSSTILVNGIRTEATPAYRYVAFHKPVGYVCSRKAQGENPTIYELLPEDMATLKPVGRLDKASSGILLLTNDGDFAHRMTHPKFSKVKVYEIRLDTALEPLHQQMISDYGVEIGDGTSKLQLERRDDTRRAWTVTMHEGRNRQIRRTFAALGYETTALRRVSFGPYRLDDLATGTHKPVSV
ncbi:rRNA pseudouridine synthase [Candidatus Saccharibacteria bacterium]|nr:rRNA pseudouridine synthase [Candidatus Saccharibacteria bacterium]